MTASLMDAWLFVWWLHRFNLALMLPAAGFVDIRELGRFRLETPGGDAAKAGLWPASRLKRVGAGNRRSPRRAPPKPRDCAKPPADEGRLPYPAYWPYVRRGVNVATTWNLPASCGHEVQITSR
jgi:hypothetical protein